jgi:hypothetical protein
MKHKCAAPACLIKKKRSSIKVRNSILRNFYLSKVRIGKLYRTFVGEVHHVEATKWLVWVFYMVGTIQYMSPHKVQTPAKITHKIKALIRYTNGVRLPNRQKETKGRHSCKEEYWLLSFTGNKNLLKSK